ncbi:MAG: APC family permease [Solirubrobacterales bacterium]|nr:APC family permease [Solirubrobacterales bacterium]
MGRRPLRRGDHEGRVQQELLERLFGRLFRRWLGLGLSQLTSTEAVGARPRAGTDPFGGATRPPAGLSPGTVRPIPPWAFTGVAICSFGGPLALTALYAPGLLADAGASTGLAMVAAVIVFTAPLAIWLRYARHVSSAGGLFAFVEAAAGRLLALAQAATWIVSYVLYLVYTTVQIVYDLLPSVMPVGRSAQTVLALLIPIGIAGVMVAGRATALIVLGLMAVGQLALAGILDGLTVAHFTTPASAFAVGAPAGSVAKAGAQTSLLYICGSLPLFLGGELARPARTIRRGLVGTYLLTTVVISLAVVPLAAAPGLLRTAVPGVTVAQLFASPGLAKATGIGVAVSIAGVILCEYLALTRLLHAIGRWRLRPITLAIGALMVAAAPFSLIDPQGFYSALVKPSLAALWTSQLIVFLAYPRFVAKRRGRALPAWTLSAAASGLAIYGLWTAL